MEEKIVWVGIRESEILYSSLFYKSITMYGSNIGNNISRNNDTTLSITNFFIDNINKLLEKSAIKLFFYSHNLAEQIIAKAPSLEQYVVNKYNKEFYQFIENKTYSHLWASNIMPVIDFKEMFGLECSYQNISKYFKNHKIFIIQENHSSGGKGTFLLTKENEMQVLESLDKYKCYKISPYYENSFSVNVHLLITSKDISILQPSIQIIEKIDNNLLYKGADFISYQLISSSIQNNINNFARKIGNSLSNMGYEGICGVDLLIYNEDVFFMEINPRFQASSILINRALSDNNLPDLQTIVYNIYKNSYSNEILKKLESIQIQYSTLSFYQNSNSKINSYMLNLFEKKPKHVDKVIVENKDASNLNEYMFRVIFNTNIASVNLDGSIFVYQNLLNYSKHELCLNDNVFLKCALLTQGVIVYEDVIEMYRNDNQHIKNATFDAIDIKIDTNFVVNCPTKSKFVELSPFSIRKYNNKPGLFFLNDFIRPIKIYLQEEVPLKHTKNNINIHRIGFLTTDRLRIKHTSLCQFKKEKSGCKFCHITGAFSQDFPIEDIYETIDCYLSSVDFRHFLIGGPSNTYEKEIYYVKNIIQYIRKKSSKPIYLMSVPPQNIDVLKIYNELGLTEVSFNIEIFDRNVAENYMPRKGKIPIEQYLRALKISSELFGSENTRSMLIIGLDSTQSFLNGIEQLCKIKVTPMISPFRPMDNTELADLVPPTIEYVLKIYVESKKICEKYGVELGPKCDFCKNNTLT